MLYLFDVVVVFDHYQYPEIEEVQHPCGSIKKIVFAYECRQNFGQLLSMLNYVTKETEIEFTFPTELTTDPKAANYL